MLKVQFDMLRITDDGLIETIDESMKSVPTAEAIRTAAPGAKMKSVTFPSFEDAKRFDSVKSVCDLDDPESTFNNDVWQKACPAILEEIREYQDRVRSHLEKLVLEGQRGVEAASGSSLGSSEDVRGESVATKVDGDDRNVLETERSSSPVPPPQTHEASSTVDPAVCVGTTASNEPAEPTVAIHKESETGDSSNQEAYSVPLLERATSVFKWSYCDHVLLFPAMFRHKSNSAFDVSAVEFDTVASRVTMAILEAVGLNPEATDQQKLLSYGKRFRCSDCNASTGSGFTCEVWPTAVSAPAFPYIHMYGDSRALTFVLTTPEAAPSTQ